MEIADAGSSGVSRLRSSFLEEEVRLVECVREHYLLGFRMIAFPETLNLHIKNTREELGHHSMTPRLVTHTTTTIPMLIIRMNLVLMDESQDWLTITQSVSYLKSRGGELRSKIK